jgi:enoyl-CoA hydratase/carnithine racemase
MGLIHVDCSDGIATVRLDRPEKRNALSFDMLRELRSLAGDLGRDRLLRAVVLAGSGESFCAGIDLAELSLRRNRLLAFWELLKPGRSLFQRAFLDWQRLPVPVIAALHGHCFGAGLQLALAADVRIATPDCQLSVMEARWGLVPDMGFTRTLRGLVRPDVARDLTYSARVLSGNQAQAVGLVTRIDASPLAAACALAREYADRSPDAVLAAKRVIDAMTHGSSARALALEKRWQLKLLLGRNMQVARARARDPARAFTPRQY